MMLKIVLAICLLAATSASSPAWDDLKVTWGINPFNSQYFQSLPRTTTEAESGGWLEIKKCDTSDTANIRGRLYVKKEHSALLIFDKNGYIAGIQTRVPGSAKFEYPKKALVPPFVKDGYNYFLNAYFTDPATICSTGRTEEDFKKNGTGTDLYIQTGPHPDKDYMKIPGAEKDLEGTKWVEGKCFWTMGKHYWYELSDDMSCDELFPVFLLYNKGHLNAFGWAMTVPLSGKRYEHPGTSVYKRFMESVPKCLSTRGEISTMHIFLTNNPKTGNFC